MAGTPMTPITGVDKGQEYDFRGAQVNDSLGTLLKGTANAFGDVIEAEHKVVNQDIRQTARNQVDAVQENLFATSDLASAQASTTEGGVAKPEDLTRGFDKMMKVKNAYMKGALTESDFLSNVDVITRGLRQRYGAAWSDEIDSAVEAAVSSSANRYRKQLFAEWEDNKSKAQTEQEKEETWKWNYVSQNQEYLLTNPEMVQDPTKFSKAQLIGATIGPRAEAESVKQAEARLKLKQEIRESTDDEAYDIGAKKVSVIIGSALGGLGNSNKDGLLEKITEFKKNGKTGTAEEKQAINDYFVGFKTQVQTGIEKMLMEDTYINLPKNRKDELRSMADQYINTYKDLIYDDKYGFMQLFNQRMHWSGEDAVNRAMNIDPSLADLVVFTQAVKSAGLQEYYNEALMETVKGRKDLDNPEIGLTFRKAGNVLLGNTPLIEYARAVAKYKKDPKEFGQVMRVLKGALSSDSVSLEDKGAAASTLFNPENGDIFADNVVSAGAATDMFNDMTDPAVMRNMLQLKEVDAVAWTRYYDWVFDSSFKSIFSQEIATMIPSGPISNLKFDDNTQQFTFKMPELPKEFTNAQENAGRKVTLSWAKEMDTTVKRLNLWIKKVSPLIKAQGLDPADEIARLLEAQDLPIEAKGKKSLVEFFKDRVLSNQEAKKNKEEQTQ